MDTDRSDRSGYIVVALLGAAAGGLFVACVSHAIPRMMNRMMAGMMDNMRAQMSSGKCQPDEF